MAPRQLLEGKVALITGAASGTSIEVCLRLHDIDCFRGF